MSNRLLPRRTGQGREASRHEVPHGRCKKKPKYGGGCSAISREKDIHFLPTAHIGQQIALNPDIGKGEYRGDGYYVLFAGKLDDELRQDSDRVVTG